MEGWEIREALMTILTEHGESMNGVELSEEMFRRYNIRISSVDTGRYMGVTKRKGWVRNNRIGYGPAQYIPTGAWHPGMDKPKPATHDGRRHVLRTAFTEVSDEMLKILLITTSGEALKKAQAEAERRKTDG